MKYTAQVTRRNKGFGPMHGFATHGYVLEDGVQIARFSRAAYAPMEFKWFTERARARFQDFCDAISCEEAVDALANPINNMQRRA